MDYFDFGISFAYRVSDAWRVRLDEIYELLLIVMEEIFWSMRVIEIAKRGNTHQVLRVKSSGSLVGYLLGCALCFACLSGCQAKKPWETAVPTSGTVTFNGKAISGAEVTLAPTGADVPNSVRPSATTKADGTFKLTTHVQEDGAPVGEYQVSVIWHPLVETGGGPSRGGNKLPERFSRPDTSKITATVKPEGGALPPFNLTK